MDAEADDVEGLGSGRRLRCCDRWRESFDKEQRGELLR